MNKFSRYFLFVLIFTLGLGLGALRYEAKDKSEFVADVPVGEVVSFVATIVDEPETTDNQVKLILKPDNSSVKVLARVSLGGDYRYGDRFTVTGTLTRPGIIGEGADAFDYGAFLAKDEIYFLLNRPTLESLPEIGGPPERSRAGSKIRRVLFDFKHLLLERLASAVPEPESSLLGGVILGGRGSLGEQEEESLRRAGLTHMIVLSGYNLSVVGDWIGRGLAPLPGRLPLFGAAGSLIAFALMAGGGAATLRALLMALIALVARLAGEQYQALRALLLAALVMILINPKILQFDLGFHLSFLATLGLIVAAPHIERRLLFVPKRFGLREVATTTISAQLFVLPWLLYWIGDFSLWTLPANLLVLPIIPLAMILTFFTVLVSLIFPPLGVVVGFFAYLPAAYILAIAKIVSFLPLSDFHFSNFPLFLTLVLYAIMGYWLLKEKKKYSKFVSKS